MQNYPFRAFQKPLRFSFFLGRDSFSLLIPPAQGRGERVDQSQLFFKFHLPRELGRVQKSGGGLARVALIELLDIRHVAALYDRQPAVLAPPRSISGTGLDDPFLAVANIARRPMPPGSTRPARVHGHLELDALLDRETGALHRL